MHGYVRTFRILFKDCTVITGVLTMLFCSVMTSPVAAQSKDNLDNGKAEPYSEDEFPSWAHDVRRAEIITIGSLPFATLGTTLCYSLARYAHNGFEFSYVPNPFAKSGAGSFNQTEQITIFATAGGISIGIGLADLIIRIIRRRKSARLEHEAQSVIITPLEDGAEGKEGGGTEGMHRYPPPLPSADSIRTMTSEEANGTEAGHNGI